MDKATRLNKTMKSQRHRLRKIKPLISATDIALKNASVGMRELSGDLREAYLDVAGIRDQHTHRLIRYNRCVLYCDSTVSVCVSIMKSHDKSVFIITKGLLFSKF